MGKIKSIDVKTTKMLVEELKVSMQKTLNKYGLKVESEGGKIGVENLDANLKFNIFKLNYYRYILQCSIIKIIIYYI